MCEHSRRTYSLGDTDAKVLILDELLDVLRQILDVPEGACILCHAEHIKVGYDFWYAGPSAIPNKGRFAQVKAWGDNGS